MNDLKDWCRVFVVIIIFSGVILRFLPKNKSNISVKILFSIVSVSFCLVQIFDEDLASFSPESIYENAVLDEDELLKFDNDFTVTLVEQVIENNLNEYLYSFNNGAYVKEIKLIVSDNCITGGEISVFGIFSEDEKDEIDKYIFRLCEGGVEVEFYE